MRIIAGEAKGRTLFAPEGDATRPTSDKIRGSLFNILGFRVEDACVLDLFGGPGALSLEALSRGARFAVVCDSAAPAMRCIRRNAENVLKETLDVGGGVTKTVCSGIAKYYSPEEMVGKTVVMVNNFAPRKMAGQVSEGMLLCAEDPDGSIRLLTVDGSVAPGSVIG